ncbi:MAG: response regulator, partial [Rhodospirillaceae bacterium]
LENTISSGCVRQADRHGLVRLAAETLLQTLGYNVTSAPDGPEALSLLQDGVPADILITDYAMPEMNGAVLIDEIRRLKPGLPTIMITGYTDRVEALEDVIVLYKPFRGDELAACMTTLLHPGTTN